MARALVLEAPRQLAVRDLPVPDIGDDDGLLRVRACGLCGTDHEQYTGELTGGFAFVPGHETVGVIEAVGARAAERWGVATGDLVAVEVFQSCRACSACVAGEYRRCERHGIADMYGFIPVDRAPGLWGGYAEYQYLAPDSMILPISADLDPVLATLFNPLGAGIRRSRVRTRSRSSWAGWMPYRLTRRTAVGNQGERLCEQLPADVVQHFRVINHARMPTSNQAATGRFRAGKPEVVTPVER